MASARLYSSWGGLTNALRTGLPQNETKDGSPDPFAALYAEPARLKEFLKGRTSTCWANKPLIEVDRRAATILTFRIASLSRRIVTFCLSRLFVFGISCLRINTARDACGARKLPAGRPPDTQSLGDVEQPDGIRAPIRIALYLTHAASFARLTKS
jgi:hypothetical protein